MPGLLILSASARIQHKNHFELKINDWPRAPVSSDCVLSALSSEGAGTPGEQEETQETRVSAERLPHSRRR